MDMIVTYKILHGLLTYPSSQYNNFLKDPMDLRFCPMDFRSNGFVQWILDPMDKSTIKEQI